MDDSDGSRLLVQTRVSGDETVLRAIGEIDLETMPIITRAAMLAVQHGTSNLALDAGDVTFIDSVGTRALIGLRQIALDNGGRFRISVASAVVFSLVQRAGLAEVLDVAPPPA